MARTGRKPTPVLDRFAAKIALSEDGCILWLGATNGTGYAQFKLSPEEGRRLVYVHRWSYEYHKGPIPTGLTIDHLCRNRLCVNPNHLEAVTQQENNLRSPSNPAALNAAKTHCIHGHLLTPDNVYISREGYRTCRACCKRRGHERYLRLTRKAS